MPEAGPVRFPSTGEYGGTISVKDTQSLFVEVCCTAFVTELAKTEEVVGEPRYDMALARCVVG